jgi:hypothetical protein
MSAPLSAAEMKAVLEEMLADIPDRPDRRSADEIANDMRLEQLAEARQLARMEPTSDADGDYWAGKWAG